MKRKDYIVYSDRTVPKSSLPKVKARRMRKNVKSLAEIQEERLNGVKKDFASNALFKGMHNIDDFFNKCGIYYLYHGEEIVYIGESSNLLHRLVQHWNNKKMIFDSFKFKIFRGSDVQRRKFESRMILKYKPKFNIKGVEKPKNTDALDHRHVSMNDIASK